MDAEHHARALLGALRVPDTESTKDTPGRLAAALTELTAGMWTDPSDHLAVTFPPESDDPGMIVVTGIPFCSMCEHHMLPFTGTATVGYLPAKGARIVGLSKLARVVQGYATRPQIQERLGEQVTTAITSRLDTLGSACVIRASHTCMTLRGARAVGAQMVTSHLAGLFRDDPTVRGEFLSLAAAGGAP